MLSDRFQTYGERRIGRFNWRGLLTLYLKEVRRFTKVWTQTVAAPAVTTLLFLLIFALALGGAGRVTAGINFERFLAPGLIMMAIIQNSFQNTVSSILIAKVQGNIVDVLMPPLSPGELTFGYVFGGATRGLMVGLSVWAAFALVPGPRVGVANPLVIIFFAFGAATLMSLVGILAALWADKFDHAAAITNFIIVPLSLLSGTFYSIERLPEGWQKVSHVNPFFYLIDGFRSGFIGRADADILVGGAFIVGLTLVMWIIVQTAIARGYGLKN